MSVVQVRLPDDVGEAIERAVAAGQISSTEDFVATALREYLSSQHELSLMAHAGIEDIAAGRFAEIDDLDAWGGANLDRAKTHTDGKPQRD